jgi:cytochrome c oxidase subunit III
MATFTPVTAMGPVDSVPTRLRRARLGLICGIVTVCMVFISLTSAYIVRQGLPTFDGNSNSYVRDWGQVDLPWMLLAINTAVLLVSSVTIELARRQAGRAIGGASLIGERSFPWLGITVLLGMGFLTGQWLAWRELHARGFFVYTNPNSSFVFLLTITHALHLAGGIVALVWAASASLLHKPVEKRRIVVDITAWYWHFMAVLWIYVFALLAFAR